MTYLYFDIECSDGNHMCSFGYTITNEKFEIIEKKDIVINPEYRFKLGRAGFDPKIDLAYSIDFFRQQHPFDFYYDEIKKLLTKKEQILLGHSIISDIKFLNDACERYNLPKIELKVFDTQNLYFQYNKKYRCRSLDNILNDLEIKHDDLMEHKSCDDAELSMRVVKSICKKMDCSIDELINLSIDSITDGKNKPNWNKPTNFASKLKQLSGKYPQQNNWKKICLSDSIICKNDNKRLNLIKTIFDNQYCYTAKASICDIFVTGNKYGKRDEVCDREIKENSKIIQKISLSNLAELLKTDINEYGETINEYDEYNQSNILSDAFVKALRKSGQTYGEFLKKCKNIG